jgi:hypothetical protein
MSAASWQVASIRQKLPDARSTAPTARRFWQVARLIGNVEQRQAFEAPARHIAYQIQEPKGQQVESNGGKPESGARGLENEQRGLHRRLLTVQPAFVSTSEMPQNTFAALISEFEG